MMKKHSYSLSVFCLLTLLSTNACSKLLGGLRKDFDDGDYEEQVASRSGGAWPERGYLSEEDESSASDAYGRVGHAGRSIASTKSNLDSHGGSWISREMEDQNRRDYFRNINPETEELAAMYGVSPVDPKKLQPKKRTTKEDFEDKVKNEGSLWASDGQTNYYFTKNKIRGPGDILSVQVEKEMLRDIVVETTRTLTPDEADMELDDAQKRFDSEGSDGVKTSSAAPSRSTASASKKKDTKGKAGADEEENLPKVKKATAEDIDVSKSLAIKEGDFLLAEIQERYPNGNFKIKATKKVPYRNGFRVVDMVGIVKGSEISEDDKVSSGKLYEYRIGVASR